MGLDQVILDGIVFIGEDAAADQGIGTDGIPGNTPYFRPSVHVGVQNLVAGNKAQKLGINNNSDKKDSAKDKQKQGLLESPSKKEKKQDGNGQGEKNGPALGKIEGKQVGCRDQEIPSPFPFWGTVQIKAKGDQ